MTIALVHTTTGTGTAVTIPSTGAGNCVVVCVASNYSSAAKVTGATLGGTGLTSLTFAGTGSSNSPYAAIFVIPNCAGGQTAIALTGTGTLSANSVVAAVYEFSGLFINPVDAVSSFAQTTGTTAWTSLSTGSTSYANEVWVGIGAEGYAGGPPAGTPAGPSSPWNNTAVIGANDCKAIAGYQIVSAIGAATYSGTAQYTGFAVGAVATFGAPNVSLPPSRFNRQQAVMAAATI